MKQVDRAKVCWNCEADVSYQATYCPFCGTDLLTSSGEPSQPSAPSQDKKFADQSLQESLASLYKPPYSIRNRQGLGVPDEREETTFQEVEPPKENPLFQSYEQMALEEQELIAPPHPDTLSNEEEVITRRGSILPLLFLMIGSHLLMLGVLILFCAKEGVVTLQWSSRFWFLYMLVGAPLVYLGGRILRRA
ncbi:MAG: hypothetical protein KDK64_07510 [Chlamydiia bacterium]|nr:hypothetical protein [Chlamydiia bacterium]